MPQIPRVTKSTQIDPMSKQPNQQNQPVFDLEKEVAHKKTVGGRTISPEKKGLDVAFAISKSQGKVEPPTPGKQSVEIILSTYSGLVTVKSVLSTLLDMATMLQSPLMKKDIEAKIMQLLNQIDYIALNTSSNSISILGNLSEEEIILFSEGKELAFRPYNVTTEELGLRAFVGKLNEEGSLERFIYAIERSMDTIAAYQSELRDISKYLGVAEKIQESQVAASILPSKAREMSDLTRALILSAYGITFFSELGKQIKDFTKIYYPVFLFVFAAIFVIFVMLGIIN